MSDDRIAFNVAVSGQTDAMPSGSRAEGRDYAVINGLYVAGLGALGAVVLRRRRQPIASTRDLAEVALATFALADVFAHEKIAHWIREPFVEETEDHRPGEPRGSGLRYAVGELLSCSRCVGSWSALSLCALRVWSPPAGRAVTSVLAAAGANDVLQAGFQLIRDAANLEEGELQAS